MAKLLGIILLFLLCVPAAEARRVEATAYSGSCDGQSTRMADGHTVYYGAVASNDLPLGTLIRLDRPLHPPGHPPRRYFRVHDRIGYGTSLDIWLKTCSAMDWFGRRTLTFRVVIPRRT